MKAKIIGVSDPGGGVISYMIVEELNNALIEVGLYGTIAVAEGCDIRWLCGRYALLRTVDLSDETVEKIRAYIKARKDDGHKEITKRKVAMTEKELRRKRIRLIAKKKILDTQVRALHLKICEIEQQLQKTCEHPRKVETKSSIRCPDCGWGVGFDTRYDM